MKSQARLGLTISDWLAIAIMVVIALAVSGNVLLSNRGHSPEGRRRPVCVNNLKHIGLALQNYHDRHRTFPPAFVADAEGKPMHSWRVLLLPYFESDYLINAQDLKELYDRYDFSERWDSPHNVELAREMPKVYSCPSDPSGSLSYLAVVGSETIWPGDKGASLRTVTDGTANTVTVVEVADCGINWLEPRDLMLEEATRGINVPGAKPGISSHHQGGAHFLFADGSVQFLSDNTPLESLRKFFTIAGNDVIPIPDN